MIVSSSDHKAQLSSWALLLWRQKAQIKIPVHILLLLKCAFKFCTGFHLLACPLILDYPERLLSQISRSCLRRSVIQHMQVWLSDYSVYCLMLLSIPRTSDIIDSYLCTSITSIQLLHLWILVELCQIPHVLISSNYGYITSASPLSRYLSGSYGYITKYLFEGLWLIEWCGFYC